MAAVIGVVLHAASTALPPAASVTGQDCLVLISMFFAVANLLETGLLSGVLLRLKRREATIALRTDARRAAASPSAGSPMLHARHMTPPPPLPGSGVDLQRTRGSDLRAAFALLAPLGGDRVLRSDAVEVLRAMARDRGFELSDADFAAEQHDGDGNRLLTFSDFVTMVGATGVTAMCAEVPKSVSVCGVAATRGSVDAFDTHYRSIAGALLVVAESLWLIAMFAWRGRSVAVVLGVLVGCLVVAGCGHGLRQHIRKQSAIAEVAAAMPRGAAHQHNTRRPVDRSM
eukprot:TRINITY_DN29965_c0_g1_i2.p2 TRINITY_DN29965_c0_g1~~TRINITY_DN29965_c0_g1_i2.p2  ORF type:complete len:286 (+),score=79.78 TRINITY_DN29965_c0_g1_i2:873-1730(+)